MAETEHDPDALEETIEGAEETKDSERLVNILNVCQAHGQDDEWETCTESCLDALYRLTKSEEMPVFLSLTLLFDVLQAWKTSEAIVEVTLGCIVSLANKEDSNKELPLERLVTILQDNAGESSIQEQACLCVERLATTHKDQLKQLNGLSEQLSAARDRITNERHKAYPGRAAAALGFEL